MIKWWNRQLGNLFQSFHIEVMAIHIFSGRTSDYPWYIFQYFENAVALTSSPLWHETGYVDGYLDNNTRKEVGKILETARDKAREAWCLTDDGGTDHKHAIEIWRGIFGEEYPVYGS